MDGINTYPKKITTPIGIKQPSPLHKFKWSNELSDPTKDWTKFAIVKLFKNGSVHANVFNNEYNINGSDARLLKIYDGNCNKSSKMFQIFYLLPSIRRKSRTFR